MELKKALGQNIKKYRKINNITQEKLAEIVGVEVISISSIETGRYFPSPDNLLKISEALKISLSDLFNFQETKTCENYIENITKKINLLKADKVKLAAIELFINSLAGN